MQTLDLPIFYTFRRCPYAIRARMAMAYAGCDALVREVDLKNKPQALIKISPKATVPVLQQSSGAILDESLDIMRFALQNADPQGWLGGADAAVDDALIAYNDQKFKPLLDRYKYGRDPHARAEAFAALDMLEQRLGHAPYLTGARLGLCDVALFPFVRQCVGVDHPSFAQQLPHLDTWRRGIEQTPLFECIMTKLTPWTPESPPLRFSEVFARPR